MVDRLLRHEDKADVNAPTAERFGRTALQAVTQGGYLVLEIDFCMLVPISTHQQLNIPVEQHSRPSL